jgi:hypothetical protein
VIWARLQRYSPQYGKVIGNRSDWPGVGGGSCRSDGEVGSDGGGAVGSGGGGGSGAVGGGGGGTLGCGNGSEVGCGSDVGGTGVG